MIECLFCVAQAGGRGFCGARLEPIGPFARGQKLASLKTRKLLVRKEELRKLGAKTQQKGLTLVPTRLYFKNGRVKCEVALARGKQHWDKRETERRKTEEREARDAIRARKARE